MSGSSLRTGQFSQNDRHQRGGCLCADAQLCQPDRALFNPVQLPQHAAPAQLQMQIIQRQGKGGIDRSQSPFRITAAGQRIHQHKPGPEMIRLLIENGTGKTDRALEAFGRQRRRRKLVHQIHRSRNIGSNGFEPVRALGKPVKGAQNLPLAASQPEVFRRKEQFLLKGGKGLRKGLIAHQGFDCQPPCLHASIRRFRPRHSHLTRSSHSGMMAAYQGVEIPMHHALKLLMRRTRCCPSSPDSMRAGFTLASSLKFSLTETTIYR